MTRSRAPFSVRNAPVVRECQRNEPRGASPGSLGVARNHLPAGQYPLPGDSHTNANTDLAGHSAARGMGLLRDYVSQAIPSLSRSSPGR